MYSNSDIEIYLKKILDQQNQANSNGKYLKLPLNFHWIK